MKAKKTTISMISILAMILLTVPVMAATDSDAVVSPTIPGTLYIDYKDNAEGTDPIEGAEFTAYRIAELGDNGEYRSLLESVPVITGETKATDIADAVEKEHQDRPEEIDSYITVTNAKGRANIQDMAQGLYLVIETKPAKDHFATIPFFVSLPYTEENTWNYDTTVEPKPSAAGYLKVSKRVNSTRDDKKQEFHFIVELNGYNEPFNYVRSDKKKGTIRSGEVFTLTNGQSVTFSMIPAGTSYRVLEKEADSNGYVTTGTGLDGNIRRTQLSYASFVNAQTPPKTGDDYWALIAAGIAVVSLVIAGALLGCVRKLREETGK